MTENGLNLVLNRLNTIFNIKSAEEEETARFKGIKHDDLCSAILYWVEQNRLLLIEPINAFITHGLREEGVDVVLNFSTSKVIIGFQVKSHSDIGEKDFPRKVKHQITGSKKHGLDKLFICLCGDLTNTSQNARMQGISSEISQIDKKDDYTYLVSPRKMIQVYDAFKEGKHPIRYVPNMASVRSIISAIVESLSDDPLYTTTVKFQQTLREEIDVTDKPHNLRLTLKDDSFDDGLTLIDKMKESTITGESFEIPGSMIADVVVNDEVINFDPELRVLPPITVLTEDENGERTPHYENIRLIREKVVDGFIHLRSRKEDFPTEFILIIDTNSHKATISFKHYYGESDAKQNLQFIKFEKQLQENNLLFFSHEQGEMGGKVKITPGEIPLTGWLEIYEKLAFIQDTIGKPIYLETSPDRDTQHDILTLYELLTEGETQKINFSPLVFKIKKKNLMLNMVEEEGQKIMKDIKINVSKFGMSSIFNYDIVLGDAVFEINKLMIDEEKTNLDILSKISDDEETEITLKRYEKSEHKLSIETLNLKVTESKDDG